MRIGPLTNLKNYQKFLTPVLAVAAVAALSMYGLLHSGVTLAQSSRGLPDFTELVEQVGPSVVNIRTTSKVSVRRPGLESPSGQGGLPRELQELFRQFGIPLPNTPNLPNTPQSPSAPESGSQPSEIERPLGAGSGFVLSADGYLMTNAHVVEGASEVLVTLTDKREFKAKVVGSDKRTDVAVVKIEASGLPFVRIGNGLTLWT
jgi:serine protease Do